jgi:predicted amidohydrolase YtcJ
MLQTMKAVNSTLTLATLAGCAQQPADVADTVYTNGKIYTVNEAQPWAEAVAIKDGRFVVVGSTADVEAVTGDETEVVDLGGAFAMPGMIDVHTHGIDAHLPSAIQLSDPSDLDLILSEIEAHVEHTNHVKALGADRLQQWYPVKSLMDRGVVVALATDYPVDQINPFVHIESAHTREHPLGEAEGTLGADEAISREAAIRAYTLNPAYILGWDDIIGSIEVGKYADMVVLDRNPLEVPVEAISDTRVVTTVFAGEVVYESGTEVASSDSAEAMRLAALTRLMASDHPCAAHDG